MWKQIKQTINQLLNTDADRSEANLQKDSNNKQTDYSMENRSNKVKGIEAKMTYQYPKNKPFPFPLAVDQPKKSSNNSRNQTPVHRKNNREPKQVKKTNESGDAVKRAPFKVQDVPSPVYGFHKQRKLNEVLDNNVQALATEALPSPEEVAKAKEIAKVDRDVMHTITDQSLDLDQRPASAYSADEFGQTGDHTRERSEESIKPPIEHAINEDNNNDAILKRQPRQMSEKKPKGEPFNVRMRPSDKKRYHDRLKERSTMNRPELIPVESQSLSTKQVEPVSQNKQLEKQSNSSTYALPLHLLDDDEASFTKDHHFIKEKSQQLVDALKEFNVNAEVVNVMQGPSVTRFEIKPESGVKVSKVKNLSDDLKLSLAAKDIRIEAPIPGKHAIGIEVPNQDTSSVGFSKIMRSKAFLASASPLTVGLGLDIAGEAIITDINKMPHGLIAGATGSGKSVCINTILLSLLYKSSPEEVRLMLIDPKMVELAPYNGLPHLVSSVITDVKAATQALKWAVDEMEARYQKFVDTGSRDITRYNAKKQEQNEGKMPYLVIVIDELADLMMAAPQDVEDSICRIAQKARACGIHLLLATQRPSVDVITGLIKSNIPTRIAFSVASQVDSRTMIDTNGAERLLGKGDMLFVENGARHPVRIQGAYVSDEEIERVTHYIKDRNSPNYLFEQEQLLNTMQHVEDADELFDEALSFISENESASTSLLQRRFKIGYNRAARLIDAFEDKGIISGQNGSKPRSILVSKEDIESIRST